MIDTLPTGDPVQDDDVPGGARPWSRPAWWFARTVIALRWPVLLAWAVLGVLVALHLPQPAPRGAGLDDITSTDNPALRVEEESARDFGFPLLSRTVLVQAAPDGLPEGVLDRAADRASEVLRDPGRAPVAAAIPVPGDARVPGVRRPGTTLVTYLFPKPGQGLGASVQGARQYAASLPATDHVVGVTGTVPARAEQERIVNSSLRLLELVSLGAVLAVVALAFGSLVAPLLTLATAGLSFVLVTWLSAWLGTRYGWHVPADLQPLMVALMLGVTTDYVVYFLAGMRAELAEGRSRPEAARATTATFGPIVAVAGVTVTAGVATLLLARNPAVRLFGPAMALSVLVSVGVAVTVLPAAMAVLGRVAFWPSRRAAAGPDDGQGARPARAVVRRGVVRVLRNRVGAAAMAAGCLAGLVLLALPVRHLHGGLPFVAALPADTETARAARAAQDGFVPGVLSPTLVQVRPAAGGPALDPAALIRLQDALGRQAHVAGVVGPREDGALSRAAGRSLGVLARADGQAARYLLLLDVDPLDATAVAAVTRLRDGAPALAVAAGLPAGTRVGVGGDTAAVAAVIEQTDRDLRVVLVAALVVNLLLLMVFLRALVAPVYLLACTALSAAATFGLTTWVFQDRLGHPGIAFFVPLATGVLLIALGSDYNLFAVGHVWEEARRRPLREAMLAALPRSSGAITTAGIALAASLGALALVPLRQFRELAFALVVGILIDALVVRTLLAPALLGLFGSFSGWPGRRLRRPPG